MNPLPRLPQNSPDLPRRAKRFYVRTRKILRLKHRLTDRPERARQWAAAFPWLAEPSEIQKATKRYQKELRIYAKTPSKFSHSEPDWTGPRYTKRERIQIDDFRNQAISCDAILIRCHKRNKKDFELK